ncbi:transcription initiation factor iia subunit 1 [Anaeramoeba flamelloides]|uniref:Transcription initiation factor iia subunit 1 n=1 Tax=Anaeramoeba flamelloides TaxID=1746091 RepID=A0ABQ8YWV8_9EUKA|nr:transcription initiation factor iia subunit 1 [Anaeramoeba flamelloides]
MELADNLYSQVIIDVIDGIREEFKFSNISNEVLEELQESWERRLEDTRVLNINSDSDVSESGSEEVGEDITSYTAAPNQDQFAVKFSDLFAPKKKLKPNFTASKPQKDYISDSETSESENENEEFDSASLLQPSSQFIGLDNRVKQLLNQKEKEKGNGNENDNEKEKENEKENEKLNEIDENEDDDEEEEDDDDELFGMGNNLTDLIQNENEENEKKNKQSNDIFYQAAQGVPEKENQKPKNEKEEENSVDNLSELEAGEEDEVEEEPLNSDDDISSSDEEETDDLILCQYDKIRMVKASKDKFRCDLKNGVLHAGGKDYVFSRVKGEFVWDEHINRNTSKNLKK